MNKEERMKCVKAMEFLVTQVNDELIFMEWLGLGVADGDIPYRETELKPDDYEILDYIKKYSHLFSDVDHYIEDENFAELMGLFLEIMHDARNDGGLWCDGILSKDFNTTLDEELNSYEN